MDMVSEPSTSTSQDAAVPLVPIISLSLFATDVSPFEGLLDRHIELVGAPSRFYKPAYAQYIIPSLVFMSWETPMLV